jgi:transcriptional regulator with XRE-family HTH domain
MERDNRFGIATRSIRKSRGIKQEDLGAEVDKRQTFISAIECGHRTGTEETRRAIADALGWPYEAMLEFGGLLAEGLSPEEAEAKALEPYFKEPPQHLNGSELENLRGFRIKTVAGSSRRLVWVNRENIKGYDHTRLQAWETTDQFKALALIDKKQRKPEPGKVFLVKTNAGVGLREIVESGGAYLLKGMWGENEAVGGKPKNWILGRAIWCQMKF